MNIGNFPGDRKADSLFDVLKGLKTIGGIYMTGNSTVQVLSSGVPAKVINFDGNMGIGNFITEDYTNNKITTTYSGNYKISAGISLDNSTIQVITLTLYIDGSPTNYTAKNTTGGWVENMVIVALATIPANTDVEIYVTSDTTAGNTTISDAQLIVEGI